MRFKGGFELSQCHGIDNQHDLPEIRVDGRGNYFLRQALNLDVNDSYMPSSRMGSVRSYSGSVHSLWSGKDFCLFMRDGSLMRLNDDLKTASLIRSGLDPSAPMRYCQVLDEVYYSNNQVIALIRNGQSRNCPEVTQRFKAPLPAGHLLEFWKGRIYVVSDRTAIFSDALVFYQYDRRRNFKLFPSRITMFCGVRDGIWVSDSGKTYFMAGEAPGEMKLVQKADYPAFQGAIRVDGASVKGDIDGDVVVWNSPKGFCIGTGDGSFKNLTEEHYRGGQGEMGFGFHRSLPGMNQYIITSKNQSVSVSAVPFGIAGTMAAELN